MILTNEWIDLSFVSDSGTGNGSTTDFSTSQPMVSQGAVWVSLDGLLLILNTHYTINISTGTVSFLTAPANAQKINIKYIRG